MPKTMPVVSYETVSGKRGTLANSGNEEAPFPQSGIMTQLEMLTENCKMIDDALTRLEGMLSFVLRPETVNTGQKPEAKVAQEQQSQVFNILADRNADLNRHIRAIHNLADYIDR